MAAPILITGAAGFIGSHVTRTLLERGLPVVGVDNFNNYYSPARKEANIEEVRRGYDQAFTLERVDIRAQDDLRRIVQAHRPRAIVHLAAMAGVRASMEDPQLYLDVNLKGTANLLDEARNAGVENFVFASTSSVYGDSSTVPFIETERCDKPLAPYPASKRSAELLGYTYHHLYGQNFTALRFFTVYGPRGRPDMMAYRVLDNIFKGTKVPLFNGGRMHRDWTYVGDIAAGVVAAVDKPLGYEIINLGRGEPVKLADFVTQIESLTGRQAALDDTPMMKADVSYTFANIDKARRLLDYDPQVSVEQGVEAFWQWYQANCM